MKKEEKSLGLSLIDTIQSSEATELIKDAGEIAIDSYLEDGLLKGIPIIGSIIALAKTAIRVSDYIFIKKVIRFMQNLESVSEYEKCEEWKKIQDDKKYAKHLGETIMLLLDKFDNLDKPAIFAKVFSSFLKREIDNSIFLRLSSAIEKTSIVDLNQLFLYLSNDCPKPRGWREYIPEDLCNRLYISGLGEILFKEDELNKQFKDVFENSIRGYVPGLYKVFDFDINPLAYTLAKIVNGDNYSDGR